MKFQNITFLNQEGREIAGRIDFPLQEIRGYAIFAHCFTCNKNLKAVSIISRELTKVGIAVLRFDFTGLGDSEGEFADTNFSTQIEDLLSASEFLRNHYQVPSMLIGHSLGGAAVIRAAGLIDSIDTVCTIGAPFSPAHVTHLFEENIGELKEKGEARVSIGGRPFTVKKQLIEDLNLHTPDEMIRTKPLLIFHSPQDTIVEIENAARIYQAARHPKSFVSLDGADHLLSKEEDAAYVGQVLGTWANRYMMEAKPEQLETNRQVVTRTMSDELATDIKSGRHILLADEPSNVPGGNDLGPDPYALLMASLGACTSMTLQLYAKRNNIDLEEARVHLSIDADYEKDCEKAEDEEKKLGLIMRELELFGNMTDEERLELRQIASKCPVHKTLSRGLHVDTKYLE